VHPEPVHDTVCKKGCPRQVPRVFKDGYENIECEDEWESYPEAGLEREEHREPDLFRQGVEAKGEKRLDDKGLEESYKELLEVRTDKEDGKKDRNEYSGKDEGPHIREVSTVSRIPAGTISFSLITLSAIVRA